MVPVIDEILRARLPIQPHALRRWQEGLREVERLLADREELLLKVKARKDKSTEAA